MTLTFDEMLLGSSVYHRPEPGHWHEQYHHAVQVHQTGQGHRTQQGHQADQGQQLEQICLGSGCQMQPLLSLSWWQLVQESLKHKHRQIMKVILIDYDPVYSIQIQNC